MDPDERFMALKKAYADIILNTAKEAAERIVVSERKAQRFESELKLAKEEALRMLLRLKHMMDAKISEAELTSMSQRKKIEELEAQLQEAEDIVRDLREDLREAQYKFGKVTNNNLKYFNSGDISTQGKTEVNRVQSSQFVEFQPPKSQAKSIVTCAMKHANQSYRNAPHDCYSTSHYTRNAYKGSPDLPSIILRSKEPELYRNGCTQRVRACDRNLLDKELSSSGQRSKENEKNLREDGGGKVIRKVISCKNAYRRNFEKKVVQADRSLPNWSSIKKRKRANRYRTSRTSSFRNALGHSVRTVPEPEISRTHSISARDAGWQSGCVGTSENEEKLVESRTDQNTTNTEKSLTGKALVENMECREGLEIPISAVNLEEISMVPMKLDPEASKTSNSLPSHMVNDRMFKYTFQRKRKKEPLIRSDDNEACRNKASEENVSLEKNSSHEKAPLENCVTDENNSLEDGTSMMEVAGSRSCFMDTNSSQDSRQLMQIAHQLISLSDEKWWR